ncbi:MAG: hypothetical protein JNK63_08470 [Chthonomonas sp.]|nr:hypothetical protein [Chthonomonas sp.]
MHLARIGVVFASEDPYSSWYGEALAHTGLLFEPITDFSYDNLLKYDAVLLCGHGKFDDTEMLHRWLDEGRRTLVVSGGSWGLEKLLGLQATNSRFTKGEVRAESSPLWPEGERSALFTGGTRTRAGAAKTLITTAEGLVGVSQHGSAWFVSPHVGQTLAFFQLGTSVETHAIGPTDGSASWDSGPLRAEFGTRLEFSEREDSLFLTPHADIIRELWIRTVLAAIGSTGKRTAILWHLPGTATHGGIISLDCDVSNPSVLFQIHAALSMTGAKTTVLSRGACLPPEVYAWLRQMGHEVGLSFHESWRTEKAKVAITSLTRIAGGQVFTASLADGAWNGLMQPYEALAQCGVHTVLSKGGTERGTSGFLFGTSHPFVAKPTPVVEIPYQTFDGHRDERVIEPAKHRHGILHSIIRLSTVQDETGFSELKRWASLLRQSGADFFTAERLTTFERARRAARVRRERDGSFLIESDSALGTITVMVQGRDISAEAGRKAAQVVRRYGHDFTALPLELGESRSGSFLLTEDRKAA